MRGIAINRSIDISLARSVNEKINSRMNLSELLTSIMDVAKELLNSEGSSLLLSDKKTGDLIFNVVIGEKGDIIIGQKVPRGKGIAGTVAETMESVIVDDAQSDPRFFKGIDKKSNFKTRNILCVPMLVMGDFVGVLEIVNTRDRDSYDDWDLEKARYVADQAAIAIHNRRLYDDLSNRIEELTALYDVSQSISSADSDDDILFDILKSLTKSMKVRKASIIIYDEKGEKLKIETSFGLPDSIIPGHEIEINSSIAGLVFKNGDPMIVSDVKNEIPESMINSDRIYITDSFISVPIYYKNKVIGVISLSDKINCKNFDSFDLRVVTTVSSHISEVYKNIQNHKNAERQKILTREIDVAAEIQRKILRKVPDSFKNHQLCAFNKPAKIVGGDFYDFFKFDENKYSILVADVSGKGIPAALFMGSSMNVVRAERRIESSPALLLKNVNKYITQDSENGMFVTLFYGLIDSHNNLITYCSAGHNDQLLIKNKTKEVIKLNAVGKALGIQHNETFEERVIIYEAGDMLILFTDGVTESLNDNAIGDEAGEKKLIELAKEYIDIGPSELISHLRKYLKNNLVNDEFIDDFTIMVIKF